MYTQHTTYPRFYIPLISWPLGGSAHCRNESRDTEDLTKPMLLAEKAMWISRLDCMLHLPWVAYQSFPRERYVSQRWNSLEIIKFDLLYNVPSSFSPSQNNLTLFCHKFVSSWADSNVNCMIK